MSEKLYELDPVDHITADAIGKPGQRVFYLHAWKGEQVLTVIIEKIQLDSLSIGIEKFLAEVRQQNPDLVEASSSYVEDLMRISPPVDPLFRVGEISLGYDQAEDSMILISRELLLDDLPSEEGAVVKLWCTRAQARALARWGAEVVKGGRPICTQCGEPMEPEGHFCPKKNGHKH